MPAMRWPPSLIVARTIRGRKLLQSLCLSRVAARLACNPTSGGSMDRWAAQRRAIHKLLLKWRPPVLQAIAVFLMTTAGASIFDWLADENRSGVPILAASIAIAGGILYGLAGKLTEWQRLRVGLFLGVFATGRPGYQEDRISRALTEFKVWAQEQHPRSFVLDGIRRDLQNREALDSAILEVTRTLHTAQQLAGSEIHDVSIWFGGRLDAVFWFGWELGRGLGVTGPIWILSDSAAEYEETFAPAGILEMPPRVDRCTQCGYPVELSTADVQSAASEMSKESAHAKETFYPAQVSGKTQRAKVEQAPGYARSELTHRTPGAVVQQLWCRASGKWDKCDHAVGTHNGDLVLAMDTSKENTAENRILVSITNSGEVFDDDVLLALVTTRALAETLDSHAAFISEVESCYDLAKAKFNTPAVARQLIVLAGPPSIAALAGSTLRDQGLWHTLNHNSNANTYELSFERGRPS